MSDPTWQGLLDEASEHGAPGRLWLELLRGVVGRVCRKYPPRIYGASGDRWGPDDIDDLVADVMEAKWLKEQQFAYMLSTASSMDHARALMGRQTQQVLAGRLGPSVTRNVTGRLSPLIRSAAAAQPSRTPLSDADIRRCADILRTAPRLPDRGKQRLSPVFTTEVLKQAASEIVAIVGSAVDEKDVMRIVDDVLSHLEPTLIDVDEWESSQFPATGPGPEEESVMREEEAMVRESAARLLASLTSEQQRILAVTTAGYVTTDAELAQHLGVSRPTAAKKKKATVERVLEQVADVPDHLRDRVIFDARDRVLPEVTL